MQEVFWQVLYVYLSDGAVILIKGLTTLMKSKLTLFSMMLIGKTSGINSTVFFCLLIQGCLGKISAVVNVQVQNQHKDIFNLHEVCFVILDAGQCVCVWWCWEGGGGVFTCSTPDFWPSTPDSSCDQGSGIVFLCKTLHTDSQCLSPSRCINTSRSNAGG